MENNYYFALIDKDNIVRIIVSVEDSDFQAEGYERVALDFHDVSVFGKKYVDGEFV